MTSGIFRDTLWNQTIPNDLRGRLVLFLLPLAWLSRACIDVLIAYLRLPYEPDPGEDTHADARVRPAVPVPRRRRRIRAGPQTTDLVGKSRQVPNTVVVAVWLIAVAAILAVGVVAAIRWPTVAAGLAFRAGYAAGVAWARLRSFGAWLLDGVKQMIE